MIKKLDEIEDKIDINKFEYNGENIWPIFRNAIGWDLAIKQNVQKVNQNNDNKKNKFEIIKIFFSNFVKLIYLFRKYDYVYFTTSDDYRMIEDKYINRLTNSLNLELKNYKILEIQSGFLQKKDEKCTNIRYIPNAFIYIFKKIISKIIKINSTVNIDSELSVYNISVNGKDTIKDYISQKTIYKFLFQIMKPKMVISTCYTFMPAIKSANDLSIKTLEFQHGTIGNHFAYSVNKSINTNFYPNYLAVFGDQDKKYLSNMNYINKKENIFAVGNMLIDYYANSQNLEILHLKNNLKYEMIISVTLQWTVIDEVVEYIKRQSKKFPNICFILIPRTKDELDKYDLNEDNIKIFSELNCYEIIANSDCHLTCYSTCGFEAPSLGVKNIFLNINGLSLKYFSDYINKYNFNNILDLNQDICEVKQLNYPYEKKEIIKSNSDYIMPNYKNNIKNLLRNIIGETFDNNN